MENLSSTITNAKNEKINKHAFSRNDKKNNKDFQSANMIHKLKKIKRNRIKGNFNGIPEFDVLTNDNNSSIINDDIHNSPVKNNKPNRFSIQYITGLIFGKTIENYEDHEYEGQDTVVDPPPANVSADIASKLEKGYDATSAWNTSLAANIISTFSDDKPSPEDIDVIKTIVSYLLAGLISIWGAYNWYFLMYYAPANGIKIPSVNQIRENVQQVRDAIDNPVIYPKPSLPWYTFLVTIFQYALWFPEVIDTFFVELFPKFTSMFLNGTACFLLIYIVLIVINQHFTLTTKDFFIDLLTDALDNTLLIIMFMVVLVLFFASLANIKMAHPVYMLFQALGKLILATVISVPAGGLLCGLYFIVYSLFGRFLYGDFDLTELIPAVILLAGIIV
jgi:hypothetical protein